ncbi:MAG: mechanosensitive ion channel family protein [Verrucomicrobia bacterium]|nr:mechanosensitive ion channel family protein [Verrucomicrobiota bacterium]
MGYTTHARTLYKLREEMDTTCTPVPSAIPMADRLWFFEIIVGILVLIAVNYIFKRIVKHVRHRSISLSPDWREKIDHILFLPFQILLWILGGTLVIEVLGRRFDFSFFESYIDAFRSTGFVICVAWVLLRWKTVLQKEFLNKEHHARKVDPGFVLVLGKITSIIIIVIAMMIILQVWGLNIAPLIAFGGIGAAAVGFSAKDVLANFFGGLMLHINRPFMIGDFIYLPDQHLEGHVEEIGWNTTTVRDKEKRPVYLPNSTFSHTLVINGSRMTHRRIEEKVGIRYEDFSKIPTLVDDLKKVISSHPDIDTHLPVLAVFSGFGQFTLDLYIDVYTLQTRYDKYLHVKHEILMMVYIELQKAGAEMPTPIVSVTGKLITS